MFKESKMKIYLKILVTLSIVLIMTGLYTVWYFKTLRPFESDQIPTLVTPNKSEDINKEVEEPELTYFDKKQLNSFNVLILGIDKRENEISRTDLMMLVNIRT